MCHPSSHRSSLARSSSSQSGSTSGYSGQASRISKMAAETPGEASVGVRSGKVMTVLGPVPAEEMGVTLMHEHLLLDASSWWKRPCCAAEIGLAERPIDTAMIGELRMNPFLNRDNCQLLEPESAIEELMKFVELGGRTVVDPTNIGIGRDPLALQRIS